MNNYLCKWLNIIENMRNDNTYKPAWGRGIIECVFLNEYSIKDNIAIIKQSDIVNKMIKYYWNQTFFFNLNQGKNPVILQKVNLLIDLYKEKNNNYPIPWDRVENFFLVKNKDFYNKLVKSILININQLVCPRFRVVNQDILEIYKINKKERLLYFYKDDIEILKDYAYILSKLLNYKWAQLLERFNLAPKISNKVKASSDSKIKRKALTEYKNFLLRYYHNEEIHDFYTNEIIKDKKEIHIDHVIPWSFIYSDDIWNLVVTRKSTNLTKSNRLPTKEELDKLKIRNKNLIDKLYDNNIKYKKDLEYSLDTNILDKLYINIRS